jgi:hypothetical protein
MATITDDIVHFLEEEEDDMRASRGIIGLTLYCLTAYAVAGAAVAAWLLSF